MAAERRDLPLEAVAACFEVEVRWLEEVWDLGLLGRAELRARGVRISVEQLETVARIVRLHRQGVNLAGIAFVLGTRR